MSRIALRVSLFVTLIGLFLGLTAGSAFAQFVEEGVAPPFGLSSPSGLIHEPDSFGTGNQLYEIGASAFNPQSDATYAYSGNGYIHRTGGTSTAFWAPVVLPAGAQVTSICAWIYDTSASSILFEWSYYALEVLEDPFYGGISFGSNDSTAGYEAFCFSPNNTIMYFGDIDADGDFEWINYRIAVYLPATDNTTRLGGAHLSFNRTISPAPASASFSDVPTGYWAFQAIEALSDSGITTGFADGTFRPENTVTRAQMATFLARALGLHYPY